MVNKVQLIGRLGLDPVIKNVGENAQVCNCRLATNEFYYNDKKERIEKTQWHNVTFWNKLAVRVSKYVQKGDMLCVEGKLIYRSYTDKEGVERFSTEVEASATYFLSSKNKKDKEQTVLQEA